VIVAEILLGVLLAAGARQVHVYYFPWRDCPACDGGRRIRSGNAHRDCKRCGATGRVRRWGAGKGK